MRKTREQERAEHAWNAVSRAVKSGHLAKYSQQAKKLPARILTSGLGQALAFLRAKNEAPQLLEDVSGWVAQCIPPAKGQQTDLLWRIVHGDSDFLRRATQEVLAYLVWVNRLADGEEAQAQRGRSADSAGSAERTAVV